jgi:hypothetical protein
MLGGDSARLASALVVRGCRRKAASTAARTDSLVALARHAVPLREGRSL